MASGVEAFEYLDSPDAPFVPSWAGWDRAPDAALGGKPHGIRPTPARPEKNAEFERRLAEETRRSFEAGRARGMEEGRKAERGAHAEAGAAEEAKRIRHAAALLEEFNGERARYFHAVEAEVVRLALAMAARILRREAGSDPLLLMGAARVALGQISGAAEVRLLVPAAELNLWSEAMALLPNLSVRPLVVAGDGMEVGECRIETSLGEADLGVGAQLAEIEAAFLGHTPAARSPEEMQRQPAGANAESVT